MNDLTKINTPFGRLDDATKGALLLAYHRGEKLLGYGGQDCPFPTWEPSIVYRVKPVTVIGTAKFHGPGPAYHSLHPYMDGAVDYKITVTFPTHDGEHVPGVYTSPEGLKVVIEVAA